MSKIVAGMFETMEQADQTARALQNERFASEDISVFYIGPPGQHDTYPIGGDVDEDRGAEGGDEGAGKGAAGGAVAGAAVGAAGGPAGAALGAAVGAYTGSVAGVMSGLGDKQSRQRGAGVMVAVNADSAGGEDSAINVLRANGAEAIEKAEGELRNGDWSDFDPVRSPVLVDDQ